MTEDHTQKIAEAARKFVAAYEHIHSPRGTWSTKEGVALAAAVEAEEKAKEPQLFTAGDLLARFNRLGDGMGYNAADGALLEIHRRAAARAEWALRTAKWDGIYGDEMIRIVRKALTSQE